MMRILQLTCHFSPNVGGVETHLDDLVLALSKRKYKVVVLAYRPLTTDARWKMWEKKANVEVFRIPWIPGLFYRLVKNPILEFLYLMPGLFLATPLVLLIKQPKAIHSHGLVAGFVGVFWGRVFGIRTVVSTHSVYNFPKRGLYTKFVRLVFANADFVLTLSEQSAKEVGRLGISKNKIKVFTYWVDLGKFKKVVGAKKKLGWKGYTVLYVGRLVNEKGVKVLLNSAKDWSENISLKIIGTGPLEASVREHVSRNGNMEYIGSVDNDKLPVYYSAADVLIVPSIHKEGFGRVILESLACGVPVIGSNMGAILEAMDESVGILVKPTKLEIAKAVEFLYKNRRRLEYYSKNARRFAQRRYSEKNVEKIISTFK